MRRPRYHILLAGIAAGFVLVSPLSGQQQPAADAAASQQQAEMLGFVSDRAARMTVPVTIDGQGPFRFVVDTGAERTVISRELANALNLDPGIVATVHSMTEVSRIPTVVIPGLKLGRRTVSGIHAPALDRGNLGAPGMLGLDSLQSQRVVFDFARRRMTIVPSGRRELPWPGGAVMVRAEGHLGRLMLADASIDGQRVLVIVDTGSQVTVANPALHRELVRRGRLGPTVPIELRSITGGRMRAEYGIARRVHIGGVNIEHLPISFADVHPFRQLGLTDRPALLLGMDTLQLFERVSVDFSNRRVRLLLAGSGSSPTIGLRTLDQAGPRLTN